MTSLLAFLIAAVAGYLLGSVPFAVIIARAHRVDIFSVGSGNPGASNVLRALGKGPGYLCFFFDAFKGVAAALIGFGMAWYGDLAHGPGEYSMGRLLAVVCLVCAIFGHSFSIFLGFRGGKGVATTIGGLFVVVPWVMLVGVFLWLVVFFSSRYVSLASIALGVSLPFSSVAFKYPVWISILCLVLAVLIVVRHRSNIQRLCAGTELRSGRNA
ncbi:MAG: glycerol-3-phosphate 1-O-acyltransferase PlsY [Opitutales bacterium]|nr:glycerol-3-phosphate 1-O-acyltransferase PlsY [Opitutales bacterium]